MIVTNDEIILIGNCDFNFIISKFDNFSVNDDFNSFILNNDIVKLILVRIKNVLFVLIMILKKKKIKNNKLKLKKMIQMILHKIGLLIFKFN